MPGVLIKAVSLAVALALVPAAVSWAGTAAIERAYPPLGRFVPVEGGRLHVLTMGPADGQPVVLLHGASGNLRDMKLALGDRLAARYRVILIDRPGHGYSDRPGGVDDGSPARQAALVHQALARLGVRKPVIVAHSWAGALATAYALAYPRDTGGLVLLAPVTHPWSGGVGSYNDIAAAPVLGPLLVHTLVVPLGPLLVEPGVREVFKPQAPPPHYAERIGAKLVLRPSEFIANAQDLTQLNAFVRGQAPRYREIKAPVAILAGDADPVVSTDIHARALARQVPQAKLTVLPGIGHMVHHAATGAVLRAIDDVAAQAR